LSHLAPSAGPEAERPDPQLLAQHCGPTSVLDYRRGAVTWATAAYAECDGITENAGGPGTNGPKSTAGPGTPIAQPDPFNPGKPRGKLLRRVGHVTIVSP
jgi:hypothetical protein